MPPNRYIYELKKLCSPSPLSKQLSKGMMLGFATVGVGYFFYDVVVSNRIFRYYAVKKDGELGRIPADIEDLIFEEIETFIKLRKAEDVEKFGGFGLNKADPFMNYKFFPAQGADFKCFGSPKLLLTSHVGVPEVFCRNGVNEEWVKKFIKGLQWRNAVQTTDDVLEELLPTFQLSKNARRFWLQRELHVLWALDWPLTFAAFNISFGIFLANVYSFLVKKLEKRKVSLPYRVFLLLYLAVTAAFCYLLFFTACNDYVQERANRGAMALGDDYVNGAIEFYRKCLERNRLLLNVFGQDGRSLFSSSGDPVKRFYELPGWNFTELLELATQFQPTEADKKPFTLIL